MDVPVKASENIDSLEMNELVGIMEEVKGYNNCSQYFGNDFTPQDHMIDFEEVKTRELEPMNAVLELENIKSVLDIESMNIETMLLENEELTQEMTQENFQDLKKKPSEEIEKTEDTINTLKNIIKKHEQTIENQIKKAEERKIVIKNRDYTMGKMKNKLSEYKNIETSLNDEVSSLKQQLASKHDIESKLNEEISSLKQQLTHKDDIESKLNDEISSLKQQLENKNSENETIQKGLNDALTKSSKSESELGSYNDLQELYTNLKNSYYSLQIEYTNLKNKPNLKRLHVEPIIDEHLKKFKTNLFEEMQLTENDLQMAKEKVLKRDTQIRAMKEYQTTLKDNVKKLETELSAEKELNTTLTKEFQDLKNQSKHLYSKYTKTLSRLTFFEEKLRKKC
uniref:Uncharacterized protein n=1 Tax=Cryptophlebia leucotreta granulosis virus TaxID=35254 RepID=A0A2H4ZK93_GVCL|nr:hypothetical protein [Cryptophlebia leucotreta granulovirus]